MRIHHISRIEMLTITRIWATLSLTKKVHPAGSNTETRIISAPDRIIA